MITCIFCEIISAFHTFVDSFRARIADIFNMCVHRVERWEGDCGREMLRNKLRNGMKRELVLSLNLNSLLTSNLIFMYKTCFKSIVMYLCDLSKINEGETNVAVQF